MDLVKQERQDTPEIMTPTSQQKESLCSPRASIRGTSASASPEIIEQVDMSKTLGGHTGRRPNEHHESPYLNHTKYPTTDIKAERIFVQDQVLDGHLMKRRRAKRTEAERIEYLQQDPYVSKFEAYRVLCASCSRWIRLRPNSTYCSIPWESHRKSCLGKKLPRNDYALERLNHMFSNDSAIRKYDSERILCRLCDAWIDVSPGDYQKTINIWFDHKAKCANTLPTPITIIETPSPHIRGATSSRYSTPSSMDKPIQAHLPEAMTHKNCVILPPLISRAYDPSLSPSLQPLSSSTSTPSSPPLSQFPSAGVPWPESNARSSSARPPSRQSGRYARDRSKSPVTRPPSPYLPKRARPVIANLLQYPAGPSVPHDGSSNHSRHVTPPRSPRPSKQPNTRGLADLVSAHGRRNFILSTILHLYSTTYEPSDELTVSILLSYLNAAMPPDKYEEFDTPEVVKAILVLQDKGHVVFHGDSLRPCD